MMMVIDGSLLLHQWIASAVLASARILPAFVFLPFFSNNIVSAPIKMPLVVIVGGALWPGGLIDLSNSDYYLYVALVLKEAFIGLFIACFFCLPFWVLHAVGCFIDNQRGATLSSSLDPISGIDTSELANYFNLFAAAIFLCNGGLNFMLESWHTSFLLSPPLDFVLPELAPLLSFLTYLMSKCIVLAAPAIVAFLIMELILGLLSKYAPQMNAFSLALTMKSSVAFFMIFIYFSTAARENVSFLSITPAHVQLWFSL